MKFTVFTKEIQDWTFGISIVRLEKPSYNGTVITISFGLLASTFMIAIPQVTHV